MNLTSTAAANPRDHSAADAKRTRQGRIQEAAKNALSRMAPLWPLKHFVAVNPFLGLLDHPFEHAAVRLQRSAGARLTMPRSFYLQALQEGRMNEADLAAAVAEAPAEAKLPKDLALLKLAMQEPEPPLGPSWPTVADTAAALTGVDWTSVVTERMSAWCADYFDAGQAPLGTPWQNQSLYTAWRAEAALDQSPEILGVAGFRAWVAALPADAHEALDLLVARLHVPAEHLESYFHRALMTLSGWAGYARYLAWTQELRGHSHPAPFELLVVRLAWEAALLEGVGHGRLRQEWLRALQTYGSIEAPSTGLEINLLLAAAYEKAWQRQWVALLDRPAVEKSAARPSLQAAFCIDVRSEIIRRSLETLDASIETIGFAGFFGFAIDYAAFGETVGSSRGPVLLAPSVKLQETIIGADAKTLQDLQRKQQTACTTLDSWKAFKTAAVSCFGFVGPLGWLFAFKLISDSLGWTRAMSPSKAAGLKPAHRRRLGPRIFKDSDRHSETGLSAEQALSMAENVLRGLSLRNRFARIVLLAGHGSTTTNNAHASGFDCGACGGHAGDVNARVAAAVLNDPAVRQGLARQGFTIPPDTVFVAGLHDTTTDAFTLYDAEKIPDTHAQDFRQLRVWLERAGSLSRHERAPRLPGAWHSEPDHAIFRRSRDWSHVRPEWGLAGCAAFVAAPRMRTRSVNLGARAFLHDYDWRLDAEFKVLELIMTAPMVVASWITLQYYGSTVDNRAFGCGNKVLHNVVGTLGVFEGNGGDLRAGLAIQSLHDGEKWIHEPLRLSVVLEAPIEAITAILSRHAQVKQLVDHRWIHLFAMDSQGQITRRYAGNLTWEPGMK